MKLKSYLLNIVESGKGAITWYCGWSWQQSIPIYSLNALSDNGTDAREQELELMPQSVHENNGSIKWLANNLVFAVLQISAEIVDASNRLFNFNDDPHKALRYAYFHTLFNSSLF
jgi:hypothetical protein